MEIELRWIPVTERLPDENAGVVWVLFFGCVIGDAIYVNSVHRWNIDELEVTHWFPRPPMPRK